MKALSTVKAGTATATPAAGGALASGNSSRVDDALLPPGPGPARKPTVGTSLASHLMPAMKELIGASASASWNGTASAPESSATTTTTTTAATLTTTTTGTTTATGSGPVGPEKLA